MGTWPEPAPAVDTIQPRSTRSFRPWRGRKTKLVGAAAVLVVLVVWAFPAAVSLAAPAFLTLNGVNGKDIAVSLNASVFDLANDNVPTLRFSADTLDLAGHGRSGPVRVQIENLSLAHDTFTGASIQVADITLRLASNRTMTAQSLDAQGPSDALAVNATFSPANLLEALGVASASVDPTSVQITNGRVSFQSKKGGQPGTIQVLSEGNGWHLTGISHNGDTFTLHTVVNVDRLSMGHFSLDSFLTSWLPTP